MRTGNNARIMQGAGRAQGAAASGWFYMGSSNFRNSFHAAMYALGIPSLCKCDPDDPQCVRRPLLYLVPY